jgi:hypothetical protein
MAARQIQKDPLNRLKDKLRETFIKRIKDTRKDNIDNRRFGFVSPCVDDESAMEVAHPEVRILVCFFIKTKTKVNNLFVPTHFILMNSCFLFFYFFFSISLCSCRLVFLILRVLYIYIKKGWQRKQAQILMANEGMSSTKWSTLFQCEDNNNNTDSISSSSSSCSSFNNNDNSINTSSGDRSIQLKRFKRYIENVIGNEMTEEEQQEFVDDPFWDSVDIAEVEAALLSVEDALTLELELQGKVLF